MRVFLQDMPDMVAAAYEDKALSPLHIASVFGHDTLVEALAEQASDCSMPALAEGAHPLHKGAVCPDLFRGSLPISTQANRTARALNGGPPQGVAGAQRRGPSKGEERHVDRCVRRWR